MHNWFAVTIDFVIVVLGVYVAVWVGNQQAAREQQRRTAKVVAALRQDLRDSMAVEEKFDQALDPALEAFKAARKRGEMPPPLFLRISGSETPPRSPCIGMLQGEIAALIDPALLWEICFYYNERDGVGQKFVRYSVFTENEILPRLKGDTRVFYTSDQTRLAPVFEAMLTGCRHGAKTLQHSTSGRAVLMIGCASHRRLGRPAGPLWAERSMSAGQSSQQDSTFQISPGRRRPAII